jgi:hypothetical protein
LGNTAVVILTFPDVGLAELIASPALLAQMWPGASHEVMMLVHMLRMSGQSLAEVLAIGLVQLLTPAVTTTSPQVGLAWERATLSGVARREDGERVAEPHARPAEVRWLEVTDVAAAGRSAFRMAG